MRSSEASVMTYQTGCPLNSPWCSGRVSEWLVRLTAIALPSTILLSGSNSSCAEAIAGLAAATGAARCPPRAARASAPAPAAPLSTSRRVWVAPRAARAARSRSSVMVDTP